MNTAHSRQSGAVTTVDCVRSSKHHEATTSARFCKAFARGCGSGEVVDEYRRGHIWAGFGQPELWSGLQSAIRSGAPWYYADHSYFPRARYRHYRVTRNAFQRSQFPDGFDTPDYNKAADLIGKPEPWTHSGRHIVVCAQTENHHSRFGDRKWLNRTLDQLAEYTDRPLCVRRNKRASVSLQHDLKDCWCLITHTSAAAIEAIMHGVPAICTGDCAASPYTKRDVVNVENPWRPDFDRWEWAAILAANQWDLSEIKNGRCWEYLTRWD